MKREMDKEFEASFDINKISQGNKVKSKSYVGRLKNLMTEVQIAGFRLKFDTNTNVKDRIKEVCNSHIKDLQKMEKAAFSPFKKRNIRKEIKRIEALKNEAINTLGDLVNSFNEQKKEKSFSAPNRSAILTAPPPLKKPPAQPQTSTQPPTSPKKILSTKPQSMSPREDKSNIRATPHATPQRPKMMDVHQQGGNWRKVILPSNVSGKNAEILKQKAAPPKFEPYQPAHKSPPPVPPRDDPAPLKQTEASLLKEKMEGPSGPLKMKKIKAEAQTESLDDLLDRLHAADKAKPLGKKPPVVPPRTGAAAPAGEPSAVTLHTPPYPPNKAREMIANKSQAANNNKPKEEVVKPMRPSS